MRHKGSYHSIIVIVVVFGGVCVYRVCLAFKYMDIGLDICQMLSVLFVQQQTIVTRVVNKGF